MFTTLDENKDHIIHHIRDKKLTLYGKRTRHGICLDWFTRQAQSFSPFAAMYHQQASTSIQQSSINQSLANYEVLTITSPAKTHYHA